MKKLVLFHRDFRGFTGGHLKVWNYFNHVLSAGYEARIAFSPQSKMDSTNPWFTSDRYVTDWEPHKADILFLAGTDWRAIPESERRHFSKPIINLIQHPRHADAKSELCGFLKNRAVRICVSKEVKDAINATGEVNGPIFVIPNGLDLSEVRETTPWGNRATDLLVCGLKAPDLARKVCAAFSDKELALRSLDDWIPRDEYLARICDAKVTIFLPRPSEGFYLPPLEGMAAGTIVVCPDCLGNRGFCHDGVNCFRPHYDPEDILLAARRALQQSEAERLQMQANAKDTIQQHSLVKERESFVPILGRIEELWAS